MQSVHIMVLQNAIRISNFCIPSITMPAYWHSHDTHKWNLAQSVPRSKQY